MESHIEQQPPCSDSSSLAASLSWPPPQIMSPPPPPSSYTCSYCKREFRTAQGLGGHMNVHRWDRARLIHHQCSSQLPASPPNPNPSRGVLDPRLSLSLLSHCATGDGGSAAPAAKPDTCRFSSAPSSSATTKDFFEVKNLELGIGACSHGDDTGDRLDLELRLSC